MDQEGFLLWADFLQQLDTDSEQVKSLICAAISRTSSERQGKVPEGDAGISGITENL